ncbi:ABC transporter permease [Chryseolinea sp. T2]|uniref:ABC transporter permease n=1 Tax=Chryseolinea sp. T2 TaxID=3129255 RepID=UPI003077A6C1
MAFGLAWQFKFPDDMFRSNILLRLRALWRNRTHAAVNILGLSLGITSAIIIFLILKFEWSFDTYRTDSDRIYRVVTSFDYGERTGYNSGATYPLVPAMRNDFPDVEYASLVDGQQAVVRVPRGDGRYEKFQEGGIVFVDSSYFDIMLQDWIEGDRRSLTRPNTVVLAASVAKKYFGDEDPINKVINYNNEFDITVTGVVKDPPMNTDFNFTIYITNQLGATKRGWDNWGATASNVNCIVKLHEGVTRQQLETKMKGWHMKYFTGDNADDGKNRTYFLQPMAEMHFNEHFWNPGGRVVSKSSLLTMGLIGAVLLLTACVNFINLNTVLIIDRSKEAGVRKVMGSSRSQLISQFLGETIMITFIALLLSSGLVELMLMQLSPLLGYRLAYRPFSDASTFIYLTGVVLIVTVLAGLYPAMKLAGFQPVKALKNKIGGDIQRGMTLRRSLIVFQLLTSQVLIVCTIIAIEQINHFMKQPLGLNSHAVVEFQIPERGPERMRTLSERMLAIQGVENFSASNTGSIADGQWSGDYEAKVNGKLIKDNAVAKLADANYVETYGIQLLYGENLVPADSATRFIINETMAKALGYSNPPEAIGTPINMWDRKAVVTGVFRDFNANSLHGKITSTIVFCDANAYYKGAVRLRTENMTETLKKVQTVWEDIFDTHIYEYKFLDDTIKGLYDAERRVTRLVALFAGVAIFIGCIGLFGLISFMARSKTKEVGIRKSLGASVGQVVMLFSKEFLILVGVSFVLSVPITYYFMNKWLSNFEYRISLNAPTFLMGVAFTCFVVLVTVGFRSYRAAVANPVDALRDE